MAGAAIALRRLVPLISLALVASLAGPPPAQAQAVTATIKGRVFDSGGSGLPGVVVLCESRSHGGSRQQAISDIEGNYRIPLLPPADDYLIRVNYPGFAPVEVGPVELDAGGTRMVNITLLTSEESTETIRVEARGSTVDTESTKTSTSYNAEFIEGLPIIGHNYQDILALAPGVTDTDGDGNPNVHGARDTGLQYRLDGGNITDPVSGTFGQNLNADIIEEIEIITSGASAEYGRADGGFANLITKSGGNDFEGRFSVSFQGRFLNGDGAGNNDINTYDDTYPGFHDLRPSLSLSGAIVRDRLWYFGSVEILDTQTPVNQIGADILVTSRGNYSFGKLTWQVDSDNKLTLQAVADPRKFTGLGLQLGVAPDSDFEFKQGGVTPQLKWTALISPQLLLESNITAFNSGISVTPVSELFAPTTVVLVKGAATTQTTQALYPCEVVNCDPRFGEKLIYRLDLLDGSVTGPYPNKIDDTRTRNAIKTDLSYTIEDAWGQHNIKSGIEFADEKFEDYPINNPILLDDSSPRRPSRGSTVPPRPDEIEGQQVLLTFQPLRTPQNASSFNSSIYLLDAWKPRPNLTLNLGVRIDREDVDTSGFDRFDPRRERRRAVSLWRAVCAAARDQGLQAAYSNCQDPATYDGKPPRDYSNLMRADDPNHPVPASVAALDLNGDGFIDNQGLEGAAQFDAFTTFPERQTSNFSITNENLSPRVSFSWDPMADGKTKIFGTWGRFYDRLFLGTISGEIGPDQVNYAFFPDPTSHNIRPGSVSRSASAITVTQIDRELRTPYTDEVTFGFERELAPEWSVGVTWIKRRGRDLLQDIDLNHVTCSEYGSVIGIDPLLICGDAGTLENDRFGAVGISPSGGNIEGGSFSFDRSYSLPNGVPDLYTVSPSFNQVLRIGNYNSSEYEAYELKVLKRLHRNWQMQMSYSWSRAWGQAESYASSLGNDPQTKDDEEGYLDFDQRHVLKYQTVIALPAGLRLGTSIQWTSGTPFSFTQRLVDQDETGNINFRQFYPTRQRNDQRNSGQWLIDGRIEKTMRIGHVLASGFLLAQNLTNSDGLVLTEFNVAARNGVGLQGSRNFGRRWEIGLSMNF